ncbi:DUF3530 family protein [Marinobacter bohaiensis]|uniref:DUF3530 family protein n=1 Tax=Marinobacter bohaiensis TaxID=2201898 RepID=UPI000DAB55EF|nr:DUF3530 family protein [Marinobacter bohaiensis]
MLTERRVWLMVALLLWSLSGLAQEPDAESEPEGAAADSAGNGNDDSAPEKPVERPFVSVGLGQEALAAQRPEQAVWLDAGAGGRVLGLLERESGSEAKGAVLVLADEGQSADTALAGALREPLAEAGWATMSLGLESPPYPLVRARRELLRLDQMPKPREVAAGDAPVQDGAGEGDADAADPAQPQPQGEPQANEDSIMIDVMARDDLDQLRNAYREQIQAQLTAAITHLRGQGYSRVALVGVGHGAALASRVAAQGVGAGPGEPALLVWVAPRLDDDDLGAVGGAPRLRLLDLRSNASASDAPKAQKGQLKRSGMPGYQQQVLAMASPPASADAALVAGRVSGWLRRTLSPPAP